MRIITLGLGGNVAAPERRQTATRPNRPSALVGLLTLTMLLSLYPLAQAEPGTFTTIDFPGASLTFASRINSGGDIVGRYITAGATHGFLLSGGEFTSIDFPGASFTTANGINPGGDIVGRYIGAGVQHGYLLSGDEFTSFDFPGASSTEAFGINPRADIVGEYSSAGVTHGFLLSGGEFTTIDFPGASSTRASNVSPQGDIVGFFVSAGVTHGFLLSGGELAFSPYAFEQISDTNGDLLEKTHPDAREVASPQACFQLLQMLRGVTQRGTGAAAASLKLNIAGKTGTTSDFTDAWFIGMTPRYTVGVWIGNDMKTVSIGPGMEGAKVALPVWMRILEKMKESGRIDPKADFDAPPNVVFTAVDYDTGLKATPSSPRPILESFVSGSQPTEEWNTRWDGITHLPWSLQKSFYLPKKGETTEDAREPSPPPSSTPAQAPAKPN